MPDYNPILRQIPEETGTFELTLTNAGNIQRHISVGASDQNKRFDYRFNPATADLQPGEMGQIQLNTMPKKWWQRPLWGKPLAFNFDLELNNALLPTVAEPTSLPLLPATLPQGKIHWQARPWWVLALLIAAIVLTIAGLSLYMWRNILRPLDAPEITAFGITKLNPLSTREPIRQEGKADALLRLDWQVKHFEAVHRITIVRLEKGIETQRKTYFFDIKRPDHKLPPHLEHKDQDQASNFCEQQPNEAEKARSQIVLVASPFFNIPYPQLKAVHPTILTCNGMTTETKEAGSYTFQIQVFSSPQQKEPIVAQTTDTIAIKPADEPKIVSLMPTQLIYQEGQGTNATAVQSTDNLDQCSTTTNGR